MNRDAAVPPADPRAPRGRRRRPLRRLGGDHQGALQDPAAQAVGRRARVQSPHQEPLRRARHRDPVPAPDGLFGVDRAGQAPPVSGRRLRRRPRGGPRRPRSRRARRRCSRSRAVAEPARRGAAAARPRACCCSAPAARDRARRARRRRGGGRAGCRRGRAADRLRGDGSRGSRTASCATLLESVAETIRLADRPPPSLIRLRRRAEDDRPRLQQALRSRGYYDARVDGRGRPGARAGAGDPAGRAGAAVPLSRGRRSTARRRRQPPILPSPAELGIAPGAPALSQAILDAEAALLAAARAQGHALAALGQRQAVVDHGADAMDLTLVLQPGPLVRFGEIDVDRA